MSGDQLHTRCLMPDKGDEQNAECISIAMATFNGANYLQEQLDSLSRQTHKPHELVVTDDGSTDETEQIVDRFSSTATFPVRFYRNISRLGYAENFFRAASLCTGHLIAFCDQDDVWLPSKLDEARKAFVDPRVFAFIHSAETVDAVLNPLGYSFPHFRRSGLSRYISWGKSPGFAIVFRRELLRIPYLRRPSGILGNPVMAHDEWIYFLADLVGRIAQSRKRLALYRQHQENQIGSTEDSSIQNVARYTAAAGFDHYSNMRTLAESRAEFAAEVRGALPDDKARLWLVAVEANCRRIAASLEKRALLYTKGANILGRIDALLRTALPGHYFRRHGLGIRALIKDSAYAVFGNSLKPLIRFMAGFR